MSKKQKSGRNILLLIIAIVLLGGVYFIFLNNRDHSSSYSDKDKAFAIADTGSITSIELEKFVKRKSKRKLKLKRTGDHWTMNSEYDVQKDKIDNLLITIRHLEVKEAISDAGKESALELLNDDYTQVKIYSAGALLKSYKVGIANKDQTGNVMLLDGARNPFIMARAGMNGYVSIHYTTFEDNWKSMTLFHADPQVLKTIIVQYKDPEKAAKSFSLNRTDTESSWILNEGASPDSLIMANYMKSFEKPVNFESWARKTYPELEDSLKTRAPDITMSWETFDNQSCTIELFERPDNPSNYFGWRTDKRELLTIQEFVMRNFLVPVDYFIQ